MAIIHIVLFEFKPIIHHKDVLAVCSKMVALPQECIHPTTQKPYIKSGTGGRDNSPEGHQGGFTHGFVMEFESVKDRDYYVHEDPTHQAFIKYAGPYIQNVRVIDFEPGKM